MKVKTNVGREKGKGVCLQLEELKRREIVTNSCLNVAGGGGREGERGDGGGWSKER